MEGWGREVKCGFREMGLEVRVVGKGGWEGGR